MKLGLFKDASLLKKLMIWAGFFALSGLIFMVLMLFTQGVNSFQASVIRTILFYQDIFLFILPAVLATCLWSERPGEWLKVNSTTDWKIVVGAMVLMIVALPGSNLLAYLNQQITLPDALAGVEQWMQQQEEAANRVLEILLADTRFGQFLMNFLVISILAGIGEEVCFRGTLQGLMNHTKAAIWVTAIIFSVIHMQFYGFIPRLLMGALFGYMLVWSNNLWIPIAMHCTNNGVIAILYYVANIRQIDTKKMDAFGTEDTLWVGILSLVMVGAGIYILRRSLTMSKASSLTSQGS